MKKHSSQFSAELSRIIVSARKRGQASPMTAINSLVKEGQKSGLSGAAVADYVSQRLRQ